MPKNVSGTLIDFFKNGATLEGRGKILSMAALATASAVILSTAFQPATAEELEIPNINKAEYTRLVNEIRYRLDAEYPDNEVLVLNIHENIGNQVQLAHDAGKAPVCLVYAPEAKSTARALAGVNVEDLPEDAYARFELWTAVGNCLGTENARHSKAFGLMMAVMDTGSPQFADVMAAYVDLEELRGNLHPAGYWSDAAYGVAEAVRTHQVRQGIRVFGASAALSFAQDVYNQHDVTHRARVGQGLHSALRLDHHYVPVEGGLVDTPDSYAWLRHARLIPEVQHYLELFDYLHEDNADRVAPGRLNLAPEASAMAVDLLASQGNSTARFLAPAFGVAVDYSYEPIRLGDDMPAREEIAGAFFAVDLDNLYVTFANDGMRFAVSDAERRPLMFGTTVSDMEPSTDLVGSTTSFAPLPTEDADEAAKFRI